MMARSDRVPGIRPHLTLGRRLDIAWRHAFPGVTSLFLMLLSVAHFGLWSLFRPSAMAPPMVFLIGLLLDLLGFLPLGVGAVTMLTTHGIAQRLRRLLARQGFSIIWLIFITVACGIAAMNWALVSLLTFSVEPPGPVLFQAGLAAAMYPAVAIPLMLAHRSMADPDLA